MRNAVNPCISAGLTRPRFRLLASLFGAMFVDVGVNQTQMSLSEVSWCRVRKERLVVLLLQQSWDMYEVELDAKAMSSDSAGALEV